MELNNVHIDFIVKELESQGLIYEPLRDEVVDHFCSAVEKEMDQGLKFRDAFDKTLKKFGKGRTLRRIQTETIRSENFNTLAMFKNYLTTGIRNLLKYKFYSLINIVGLAIGIAAVILISVYIQYETSYDTHLKDSERILRVTSNHLFDGQVFHAGVTPAPLAARVADDYPEIEASTRFTNWGTVIFSINDRSFKEEGVLLADSNLLDVFNFELVSGDPETILRRQNSIIISESTAKKYFGQEQAVGKLIKDGSNNEFAIEGVFRDIPNNTHFSPTVFISMSSTGRANNDNWLSNNFFTYIKIKEGSDWKALDSKLDELVIKYVGPQLMTIAGLTIEQAAENGMKAEYYLIPIEDIHLKSQSSIELGTNGDITYVYIFMSIAAFILIIACINFMNLATARSVTRAKEVGVRKVMGSLRSHLVKQFLTESFLVVLISYLIGVLLAEVTLPFFNEMAGSQLSIPITSQLFIILSILGIFIVSLLAGSYPAFYLSSFKPISIIGGMLKIKSGKGYLRSGLVIFQFGISIFLIAATAVVFNQLNYIQKKNLGFKKDQILLIHDSYLLGPQLQSFKNSMEEYAEVQSVTVSSFLPTTSSRSDNTYFPEGKHDLESAVNMQSWSVDENYIDVFGLELADGRNFDPSNAADQMAVIVNEECAKSLGYGDNPVGKTISSYYYDFSTGQMRQDSLIHYNIIGVVEDFHFNSLKSNIGPLALFNNSSSYYTAIKFNSENASSVITIAETEWNNSGENQPFSYSFLDDRFNEMYKAETRTGTIFASFAVLAIIIACLGLFALSAYTVERRTKEIGIRKVMGASSRSIVYMLSKEFSKLVLIAFVLVIPLVYFGAEYWLSAFAYKQEPGWMLFIIPGVVALIIATVTMSFQSIRAARSNPANSLRSE